MEQITENLRDDLEGDLKAMQGRLSTVETWTKLTPEQRASIVQARNRAGIAAGRLAEAEVIGPPVVDPPVDPDPDPDPEPEPEPEPEPPVEVIPAGYTERKPAGWISTAIPAKSFIRDYRGGMFVDGGNGLWLRRCDLGPSTNQYFAWRGDPVAKVSRDLVMEDCDVHDVLVTNDTHSEGIWISNAEGVTLRRCRFWRNAHFNIAFRDFPLPNGRGNVKGALVEDCRFASTPTSGPSRGYYAVQCMPNHQIVFRRCVFGQAVDVGGTVAGGVKRNGTFGSVVFEDCTWPDDPTAGIPEAA